MAGNQELIDTIVDPIAVKQVSDLNLKIQELEATFIAASKSALAFNSAAGGSSTNSAFVKNVNESTKATQKLIETRDKLSKTIISNSQAEVDAYNKVAAGEAGITEPVTKRNRAEAQQANDASARSVKAIAQQQAQAAEYVRAQGIIEKLSTKLKFYKQAQIEATDPRVIEKYAQKIQQTEGSIKQLTNAGKTGFDALGNAVGKSTNYFQKAFNSLKFIANILPGIGLAGLIGFAAGPIIDYIAQLDIFKKKASEIVSDTAIDSTDFKDALSAVNALKTSIDEFDTGRISGKELVDRYNETIGKTAGILTTTAEVEAFYNSKADAYVQAMYLRASANAALQASTDKLAEAQKRAIDDPTLLDKFKAVISVFGRLQGQIGTIGAKTFGSDAKAARDKAVSDLNKQAKDGLKLFDQLKKESDAYNKANGFGDLDGAKRESERLKRLADAKKAAADAKKRLEDASKAEDEAQNRALADRKRGLDAELKLQEQADKEAEDLRKQNLSDSENFLSNENSARLLAVEKNASDELDVLSEQYTSGLISKKEYEAKRIAIENAANLESIDSAIAYAENLIQLQKSRGKDTQSEEEKLAKLQIQHSKAVRDAKIKDNEDVKASQSELNAKIKELADETANFVVSLVDAGFENRKNKIQEEINLVDENSKAEIEAVNRSLDTQVNKASKIQVIEAQADAQKKQLQREQKKADIEKAKFDKAVAIARVIENTAIAVSQYGFFTPFGILAAALGAVQIATLIATPIPAYEKGTNNAKGGTSLVGERGPEYVITPQGATFLTHGKPTLMDIPKGSTVIPHLQTARMMDVKNYAGGQATDMSGVIQAINANKPFKGKTVMNGWHKELRAASNWEQRKKEYFN